MEIFNLVIASSLLLSLVVFSRIVVGGGVSAMTHDPLLPVSEMWLETRDGKWECVGCRVITQVRGDTITKVINAIQPHRERDKEFYGADFSEGWLRCFENCESTIEGLRDKI